MRNNLKSMILMAILVAGNDLSAAETANLSLRNEVGRSIDRGVTWLLKAQNEDGTWGDREHPALTALALMAIQGQPDDAAVRRASNAIARARRSLVQNARPDGGIHRGQLPNYNTALALTALCQGPEQPPLELVRRARAFLIGLQVDQNLPGKIDSPMDGGIGYGSKYPHSDMNNTFTALEALYYSRRFESADQPEVKDLNWPALLNFVQSCQNLPGTNQESWVSGDPANHGGFIYFPGHSMAGETNLPGGRTALRSYGSISYAGLLSYSYADLKKDDPRVRAVLEWLNKNYTLEENPGMGPQGLYYYYFLMTKALTAQGLSHLQPATGQRVDWRSEVALRLINLQQPDHSWVNGNGRWWEKDPGLVTSYALLALEMVWRRL